MNQEWKIPEPKIINTREEGSEIRKVEGEWPVAPTILILLF